MTLASYTYSSCYQFTPWYLSSHTVTTTTPSASKLCVTATKLLRSQVSSRCRAVIWHQTSIARKNISAASNQRNGSGQCRGYRNALAENRDEENIPKWAHGFNVSTSHVDGSGERILTKTSDIGNMGKYLPVLLHSGRHDWHCCHYAGDRAVLPRMLESCVRIHLGLSEYGPS
jgi:hypothetical protein